MPDGVNGRQIFLPAAKKNRRLPLVKKIEQSAGSRRANGAANFSMPANNILNAALTMSCQHLPIGELHYDPRHKRASAITHAHIRGVSRY